MGSAVRQLALLLLCTLSCAASVPAQIEHVLLISVDGMHSVDLANYIKLRPKSNLASLAARGATYTRAFTSQPSDSFPGITGLLTGANPVSTGVYYDVSYDRTYYPPGSGCTGPVGSVVDYSEAADYNSTDINGGGGIDPAHLPLVLSGTTCTPAYPHTLNRVSNIFEAVKSAGGTTAWADKHPSYDLVRGKSGSGVDDLYTPEVASVTPNTLAAYNAWDDLHWTAFIDWSQGYNYDGTSAALFNGTAPTIYGGNLQSFTQSQSRVGYVGDLGTFSSALLGSLDHTDTQLGNLLASIRFQGDHSSTLTIITAKHGGAPISKRALLDRKYLDFAEIPGVKGEPAAATVDDVALIWLNNQSRAHEVAHALYRNKKHISLDRVLFGTDILAQFGNPLIDSRVPDLVALPFPGTIWGVPKGTLFDHGGFSFEDTSVGLLVSNPTLFPSAKTYQGPVYTTQVAPTILKVLGKDASLLDGAVAEGTPVLPGF